MGKKREQGYILRYNGKQWRPQVRKIFDSYILSKLSKKYKKGDIGLWRDDQLTAKSKADLQIERTKKLISTTQKYQTEYYNHG